MNREWHQAHRMPPRATLEQRVQWHLEHQKHCSCREMPESVRAELARRGLPIAEPDRPAQP